MLNLLKTFASSVKMWTAYHSSPRLIWVLLVYLFLLLEAGLNQTTYNECEDQRVIFTAEPTDIEVSCGIDYTADFPCLYRGTLTQPYWRINSTIYTSITSHLPKDHTYRSNVLRVTSLDDKNGTEYQCFILSFQDGSICSYQSTIGRLIINCKDFKVQSSPSYHYDNQTLKGIDTTITQMDSFDNSFEITYTNTNDDEMMCGRTIINGSTCVNGVCNHNFGTQSSSCNNGTNITVSATANLELVKDVKVAKIDGINKFLELNIGAVNMRKSSQLVRVICTFIEQPVEGEKTCTFAVRPNCTNDTYYVISEAIALDSRSVSWVIDTSDMGSFNEFCFTSTGSNGSTEVTIEGKYYGDQDTVTVTSSRGGCSFLTENAILFSVIFYAYTSIIILSLM